MRARPFWVKILMHRNIAPVFKSVFSQSLYEKLNKYPRLGYWPQIEEPRTFNEKVMHRKVYTNKEIYSTVEDKYSARKYVKEKYSDEILPDIYYITTDPQTIPFDELPNEFVIKATHGSGEILIVDNLSKEDNEEIRETCSEWISESGRPETNEYWYDEITPRIIIEERLHDDEHDIPPDYKFFVFNGVVEYIQVDFDRFSDHTRRFYDADWNAQEFRYGDPLGPEIDEPKKLNKMTNIAEKLGEDFDFIRVDLYLLDNERIVFGELTIAPTSGSKPFYPQKLDFELGALW